MTSRTAKPALGITTGLELPSAIGRSLLPGENRIALETSFALRTLHPPGSPDSPHSVGPATEAHTGYVGMAWQVGIVKYVAFGLQSRTTWPYGRQQVGSAPDSYGVPEHWSHLGSHSLVVRGNFPLPDLPVTLSIIGTAGFSSHIDITEDEQSWKEVCTTTCYQERTTDYGWGGKDTDVTSRSKSNTATWREGWEISNGSVHGTGSLSAQAAVDVGKNVTLLLLSTLQPGSVDRDGEKLNLFADESVPEHRWEDFPVVTVGGGVDLLYRPVYLVVTGYFPFDWRDDVEYGAGRSMQAGFQF